MSTSDKGKQPEASYPHQGLIVAGAELLHWGPIDDNPHIIVQKAGKGNPDPFFVFTPEKGDSLAVCQYGGLWYALDVTQTGHYTLGKPQPDVSRYDVIDDSSHSGTQSPPSIDSHPASHSV